MDQFVDDCEIESSKSGTCDRNYVDTLPLNHKKLPETQSCLAILAHHTCQWQQDHHQHQDHIQDQLT